MQKELSNDQRSRLEQIARDEFQMRQSEVYKEKKETFLSWKRNEIKTFSKLAMAKEALAAQKKYFNLKQRIDKKGFSISADGLFTINETNYSGVSDIKKSVHPKFADERAKTNQDPNEWRRALNEVLSVIWSMEKTFEACMSLIHKSVSKIK